MKVVLVPGPRNEELINRIKQIKTASPDEAWEQLQEYEETEEFFDALFYACENGEEMLREQMEYFQHALMHEENEYFVQRMLADYYLFLFIIHNMDYPPFFYYLFGKLLIAFSMIIITQIF